jgi:nitrite reductase/ring-hydroxylating ferredoxin subunit
MPVQRDRTDGRGDEDPGVVQKLLVQLCNVADVAPDRPVQVTIGDTSYAVFQVVDDYFVTEDQCSHGPGQLSEGYVEDYQVECPFHGGRFDLRTGAPTEPPCIKPIRVWTPVVVNGSICIETGDGGTTSDRTPPLDGRT